VSGVNNQSSWIGDGWDMTSGFVERRYVPCSEDQDDDSADRAPNNPTRDTGDLCWDSDNAFLVFNGSSTPLVKKDDPGTANAVEWVPEADDGTLVQQYDAGTDTARATEYWKVTTSDGTQYFFGKDERFAGDSLNQGSRWTVPVYGNHVGEPGHESSFRASSVRMGWRFMLDYTTDTSGNSMTYKYRTETNRYGANNNAGDGSGDPDTKAVPYTRGGTLEWVSYGTRAGGEPTAADGAGSPYLVNFNIGERCLKSTGCVLADATKAQRTSWHDSPLDLRCTSTTSCKDMQFPAFFSTKRLTSVTSKVMAGGSLRPVNTWTLNHSWRDPGDGTGRILWLGKIGRTAHGDWTTSDDDISFGPVVFSGGEQFPGRVDDSSTDGYPAMNRIRLTGITTETGAVIGITYTSAACSHTSSNGSISEAEQKANTQRCFPVRWHPWGEKNPRTEWFNSYMVQAVTQSPGNDAVLGPQVKTNYAYSGGVAWGKVDDALVPKKDRTWSVLRGYETVSVTTGTTAQTAKTTTRYLRGTGETLSVDSAITDRSVEDHERFAGSPLATTVYNGADWISKTITIPTQTETARTGTVADGDLLIATRATRSDTYAANYDAAARLEHVTRKDDRFNEFGMVTQTDDFGAWSLDAEKNDPSDDLCTRATYLGPTGGHVVVPKDTETLAGACAATPSRPDDVVSATRMAYDGKGYGETPTKGLVTAVTSLDPETGTFTADSPVTTTGYDTRGRVNSQKDALDRGSTTVYNETAGVVTETVNTSPDPDGAGTLTAHVTTTALDPLLGVPVEVTDPNGRKTTADYDAARRLTAVWYPDRAGESASVKYAYDVTRRGVNAVTTDTLAADGTSYHRSTQIYDGLLRQIQTQSESLDGHAKAVAGRLVVDTEYDSYGRVITVSSPWFARGTPSTVLLAARTVPDATTVYEHDGAGRVTDAILFQGNVTNPDYEKWRTVTHYDGATTTVVPPKGGVPTQTILDPRGRTAELRQYQRPTTSGESGLAQILDLDFQAATYTYDEAGRLKTVLDGEDNTWSYGYDWLGRQTSASDPDSGKTETKYDVAGQVTTVTDATGKTVAYTYDALGRRTSARDDSVTSTAVRAKWYYDAYHAQAGANAGKLLKGQATASVRMVGTEEYVTALTSVDAAYRPTGSVTVVPSATGLTGLAGRYESSMTYTADGQVKSQTYAAAGNLRKETVTTMYNDASMPEWMSGGFGWGTYVATSRFDAYGRLGYMDLGNTYGTVVSYEYEVGTSRLTNLRLDRERIGGTELDLRYEYDPAGNVLSVKDVPSAQGRAADKQCFAYDSLRRLTEAWTPGTGNCGLARSIPGLGGASPYWSSWEYDGLGNRTSETYRTPGQDGGLVTTTDSTYGGSRDLDGDGNATDAGEFAGPHALTGLEVTSNAAMSAGTVKSSYTYDKAGRTVSRTTSTDYERVAQSLTWDRESELAGVSSATTVWPEPEPGSGADDDAGDPGGDPNAPDPDLGEGTTTTATSTNLYTADGDRLLRTAPDGSVTLYVGGQEVTRSSSGVVSAVRYYAFAGQTVGMRTASGLGGVTSLVNDPHGTAVASVHNTNWTTTSVDKHYTLPFGGSRGGAEMPGDRAFLGKTKDSATGLVLIGARWYDEVVGRFLTVDPVMDLKDPQQWNGYAYAGNSPLTKSDPTGLREFANDDPRDDTQAQIHSAVQHGLGNEVGDPTGASNDPEDEGVTDDPAIDLCTVLLLCPGDEEPINYPKWIDDFDMAADRKWVEMFNGLDAAAEISLACLLDVYRCDEFAMMVDEMPEATVEGTVADAREIEGAFATGHYAEGAGLVSVAVVSVVGLKGVGTGKAAVPRTADGKYAPRDGQPGRDGAPDEAAAWDQLTVDGAIVSRVETPVSVPGLGGRKYDGTVQIYGQWYGIEVKGGTAKRSPSQRAIDGWLNTPGNTVRTSDGRTLVGVFDVWIDR
jgi:RHS repeat-associated protein